MDARPVNQAHLKTTCAADLRGVALVNAAGTVTAIYQTGSPELATHWLRDVAPPISSLVDAQPPEVQQRVWAKVTQAWTPYTTADGSVRLENQAGIPSASYHSNSFAIAPSTACTSPRPKAS
jgi:hypothetical protein